MFTHKLQSARALYVVKNEGVLEITGSHVHPKW